MSLQTLPAIRFVLLAAMLNSAAGHASVTVEFLGAPSQWTTAEKETAIYIKATAGTISGLHCWISSLITERGDSAPRDAFQCTAPEQLNPGAAAQISLKYSPSSALKRGTYNAVLQILGTDQAGAAVSQSTTLKVVLPAVAVKVDEADTIRVRITRYIPGISANATFPVGMRVTSDLSPTRLPEAVVMQLYVQDGDSKDVVPSGYLKGYFCNLGAPTAQDAKTKDPKCWDKNALPPNTEIQGLEGKVFQLDAAVPAEVQKASGVLRLRSPEFASEVETPVLLLVKDWWPWAALVVFLGQLLSFWVNNWIAVGRQRIWNKLELAPLEAKLIGVPTSVGGLYTDSLSTGAQAISSKTAIAE